MKRFLGSVILLACPVAAYALDCFDAAAYYQGVHPGILRAIAIKENPKCDGTVRRNTNGSLDMGCMQINSVHYDDLAKFGVLPEHLKNQCNNIFVGAWHYRRKVVKYGNTWAAVGAYHSETPDKRDRYAADVKAIYEKYRPWLDPK